MGALGQSASASLGRLAQSAVGRGSARLLTALGQLAFPLGCAACGAGLQNEGTFCAACAEEVRLLTGPEHVFHGESARSWETASALAAYDGPLGQALRGFKYHRRLAAGAALAEWLAKEIPAQWLADIDLIAPVPLHPRRLLSRGFNQAVLLFRPLSQKFEIPLALGLLARLRNTRPQVDLPPRERQSNVAGAFGVKRPGQALERRVLLVDDVYTTGATVKECARALLEEGAAQVQVLTLARTSQGSPDIS